MQTVARLDGEAGGREAPRGLGDAPRGALGGGGGLTPSVSPPGRSEGSPLYQTPSTLSVPLLFNPRGPHLPEDPKKRKSECLNCAPR